MINQFKEEYRFLSNFYDVPIEFEGHTYKSIEHAYVASKTLCEGEREYVRLIDTAGKVKRIGKTLDIRPDWDYVKVDFMLNFLRQKFSQEPFKSLLLATDNQEIVEGNVWHDNFWGNCDCKGCGNRKGENTLGKLLMQVRNEVRLGLDFSK